LALTSPQRTSHHTTTANLFQHTAAGFPYNEPKLQTYPNSVNTSWGTNIFTILLTSETNTKHYNHENY
jgi:hypothetical protein